MKEQWRLTLKQQQLVEDNIQLIYGWICCYKIKVRDYDDLISHLQESLCRAAAKFKPQYKCKFSTFAYACFHNGFKKYLKNISKHEIKFEPIRDMPAKEDTLCKDMIFDNSHSWDKYEKVLLSNTLSKNKIRNTEIVKKRLWEGKLLREVGQETGVTRERARQITNKAITILHNHFKNNL
jgi:RNA polymerase sigma factor (sigma-70 family)